MTVMSYPRSLATVVCICAAASCGGDAQPPSVVTALSQGGNPLGLALYATNVYWTDYGTGAVMKSPIAAPGVPWVKNTPTTLAFVPPAPCGGPVAIAVDSTSAYFTTWEQCQASAPGSYPFAEVMKISLAGGAARILAGSQVGGPMGVVGDPGDIAVDEANVYWMAGGSLLIEPSAGGAPRQLVLGSPIAALGRSSGLFTLEGTSVHWISQGGDVITNGNMVSYSWVVT
ncbi:MAG: hypothetical protein ACREJ3_09735, partial [Polyangiaceae bacterium]